MPPNPLQRQKIQEQHSPAGATMEQHQEEEEEEEEEEKKEKEEEKEEDCQANVPDHNSNAVRSKNANNTTGDTNNGRTGPPGLNGTASLSCAESGGGDDDGGDNAGMATTAVDSFRHNMNIANDEVDEASLSMSFRRVPVQRHHSSSQTIDGSSGNGRRRRTTVVNDSGIDDNGERSSSFHRRQRRHGRSNSDIPTSVHAPAPAVNEAVANHHNSYPYLMPTNTMMQPPLPPYPLRHSANTPIGGMPPPPPPPHSRYPATYGSLNNNGSYQHHYGHINPSFSYHYDQQQQPLPPQGAVFGNAAAAATPAAGAGPPRPRASSFSWEPPPQSPSSSTYIAMGNNTNNNGSHRPGINGAHHRKSRSYTSDPMGRGGAAAGADLGVAEFSPRNEWRKLARSLSSSSPRNGTNNNNNNNNHHRRIDSNDTAGSYRQQQQRPHRRNESGSSYDGSYYSVGGGGGGSGGGSPLVPLFLPPPPYHLPPPPPPYHVPLPPSPPMMTTTITIPQPQRDGTEQPLRCRNVFYLLLFVFHLILVLYTGQHYLDEAIRDNGRDQSPHNGTDDSIIIDGSTNNDDHVGNGGEAVAVMIDLLNVDNVIRIAAYSGAFCISLPMLLLFILGIVGPRLFIQTALFMTIAMSFLWGTMGIGLWPHSAVPITGMIGFALAIAYAVIVWDRINLSAANLQTAMVILRRHYGIAVVAVVVQLLALVYVVYFSLVACGVYSWIQQMWPMQRQQNALALDDGVGGNYGNGHSLAAHLMKNHKGVDRFWGRMPMSVGLERTIYVLLTISFYWTLQVLHGTVQAVTAAVVRAWWFASSNPGQHDMGESGAVVALALFRTVFYSLGSICFGSLLVGPVRLLRLLSVPFRPGGDASHSLAVLHELLHAVQKCVTVAVAFVAARVNHWCYIYIGMYHYDFFEAGYNATQDFELRGWTTIVSDDLVANVFFLTSLMVGGLTGCFTNLLSTSNVDGLDVQWQRPLPLWSSTAQDADAFVNDDAAVDGNDKPGLATFVIGAFVGLVLSSIVFGVISSAVDAVLVCFCTADPHVLKVHHPDLSWNMQQAWREVWPGALDDDDDHDDDHHHQHRPGSSDPLFAAHLHHHRHARRRSSSRGVSAAISSSLRASMPLPSSPRVIYGGGSNAVPSSSSDELHPLLL